MSLPEPERMSSPLLLAPAGNPQAVRAALEAGADAIYVGLRGWSRGGARREMDRDQLARAQREVSGAGRKLQVAVNTIPRTRERVRLLEEMAALRDLGIDEIIVNDPGILVALRRRFPDLKVTASIGCGARTIADVAFLRDLGAHAAVLPGTVSPAEAREIAKVPGIAIEIMVHMVEEFVLLGKCWMPSFLHLAPTPLAGSCDGIEAPESARVGFRQTGSMKRGGVGACFRICQQSWDLYADGRRVDARRLPGRQISGIAQVRAYADAGVHVLKLQGRSLPPELLAPLVRGYRDAIDSRGWMPASSAPRPPLPDTWTVVGR